MTRSSKAMGAAAVGAVLAIGLAGGGAYYAASGGEACTACHEIQRNYDAWHTSSHRGVKCGACHGDVFTLDVRFHLANLRRLGKHISGDVPDPVRLRNTDVHQMMERCRTCHQQEFAQWQSGPHSATYERLFLDRKHNSQRVLMDDCLRCHGMHYEGGIRDLVTPVDTKGPWRLTDASLAGRPTIPCLACHQVHRDGAPMKKPAQPSPRAATAEELHRPSLALFDRRESSHYSVKILPLPRVKDGPRPVKISPDSRQALCYQCHAPLATMQAGSGDDRTPLGVHEGLSCLACHQKHGQQTRASCANCHPRLSNCGLDVEKMDTTFRSPVSRHNIHTVKCADCHEKGVPPRRRLTQAD